MARAPKIEQVDPGEQLMVRLAWACEVQGLTQAEAAEKFGVTRLRVNKLLGEARAKGVVRISIDSAYAPCAALENQLCIRYGLETANVVPVAGDGTRRDLYRMLGSALAQYLSEFLSDPDVKNFGLTWGNTLNMATRFMKPLERPDLEILSVMGGLSRGSDINGFEITTRVSNICQARHSYFPAPVYADSAEAREVLRGQKSFQMMFDKITHMDGLAIGAGAMSHSRLFKDALPDGISVEELKKLGAVGHVLGYFLNQDGDCIQHRINQYVLGLDLERLDDVPNVTLAAGGQSKFDIIRALLRRGCLNHLVIDEATAVALVQPSNS